MGSLQKLFRVELAKIFVQRGSRQLNSNKMYQDVLTIEQIGQYQDAFKGFCTTDGSCTSSQIGPIMRTFGQNPSEAVIQDMVNQADYENAEDQIREAFQVFDGNGNGYINRGELS